MSRTVWVYQKGYLKPHRATTILVLGILGFVVCGLLGTAAWVMGNSDLQEMSEGTMDSSGRDLTNAGRICGMISTGLMIIPVTFGIFLLLARAFAQQ